MSKSKLRSLEQEEALYALQCVESIEKDSKKESEYLSLVNRLPAMLLTSGIGQTLAFLQAKGEDHHNLLMTHITTWLTKERGVYPAEGSIIKHLMENDMNAYINAQQLTLRLLSWLVRFAKAYLKSEKGD
jgi:CRISPR-associated protein Cmr5